MTLDKAYSVVISTGIKPTMYYSPPPAVGGSATNLDLMHNIFQLSSFQIDERTLLDFIERAIGTYENDRFNAFWRTINPLFWFGLVLNYIVGLPFKAIGKLGFNQKKIESSMIGRIAKGILYLIVVLPVFLRALEEIGYYLDKFISLIHNWTR